MSKQRALEAAQKRAVKNAARINGCPLHDFDWRGAIKAEKNRRLAMQEETGIILNVRTPIYCRCKNCGGKNLGFFLGAFMGGGKAGPGEKKKKGTEGGGQKSD